MDKQTITEIWRGFTKEEQALLRQYLHTPMDECPREAQDLKRIYWRAMKQKSRASSKDPVPKAHRNKHYMEWLVLNGYSTKVFCPKLYKRFQQEGSLQ